jgi:hypothetical protein
MLRIFLLNLIFEGFIILEISGQMDVKDNPLCKLHPLRKMVNDRVSRGKKFFCRIHKNSFG